MATLDDDTTSSDDSGGEEERLSAFERVVKKDAYRRALDLDEQLDRYAATEGRLETMKAKMTLYVKNTATEYDPDREAQTFTIQVTPETSVKKIREKIFRTMGLASVGKEKFDSDSEEEEAEALAAKKMKSLKLIYAGQVMEDGAIFDDLPWRKERWKWSKPFAGVVWVSPFMPEPKFKSLRT